VRSRIAWAVVVLTATAVVLDTIFTAAHRPLFSEATWADHGWPLAPLGNLGCALMGALIVSRHPRHPLGWLLSGASLLSVTLAAEAYSIWVLDGDGPGSRHWGHLAAWAGPLLGWPAFTALILVFLLSPDGHLPSRRWRWAVWVTLVGLVLRTGATLTIHPGEVVYGQDHGYRPVTLPLLTVGYLLVAAGLLASVVSMVLRLRRATDDTRRQLLWVASSAAFLALGVAVILIVPRAQGEEGTWLAALPLHLAQLTVPLCVAVAVLRHRLLEIDLIVNRALVLAIATGLVGAGYVAVVVIVGLTIGDGAGGFWPSLLATAVVAVAFQPLRRRVVKIADRLAFGAASAPYEALADFSRRLGDSPDPSHLLPAVADEAAQAVNATRVTVLLHVGAGPDRVATWPVTGTGAAASRLAIPVVDAGEQLGSITVDIPAGRAVRPHEQRLLADLADQAGLAFRNARLTAELSGQVEQLAHRTRELDESRRRLITAGDAERSRIERAIAGQVVLHLEPLPEHLLQLSRLDEAGTVVLSAELIGPPIESLATALDSLRDITRGVFPAQLVRAGLPIALGSLLARPRTAGRLVVESSATDARFEPRTEAAAYFCVAEAAQNFDDPVVTLTTDQDRLHLLITGRGRGGLPLAQMRDRVEAAGGSMTVTFTSDQTVVEVHASALSALVG
jgi:GAF domain-containing protein